MRVFCLVLLSREYVVVVLVLYCLCFVFFSRALDYLGYFKFTNLMPEGHSIFLQLAGAAHPNGLFLVLCSVLLLCYSFPHFLGLELAFATNANLGHRTCFLFRARV